MKTITEDCMQRASRAESIRRSVLPPATKAVPINVTEFKKSGYRCITPKAAVEQQPYQIVRPDGTVAAAIDSMLEGGLRPKRIWFWEERSYDRLSDIAAAVLRVEKRNGRIV